MYSKIQGNKKNKEQPEHKDRRRTKLSNDSKRGERGTFAGLIWFIGWLFTIGFVGLGFWKAVLGIIIWPYFLGVALK